MMSDGFFWNDESTTFVFADEFRDEYAVVVIEIANGALKSDVIAIPKQSICTDVSSCVERLASAQFAAPGIDLVFRGVNGTPAKESHVLIGKNDRGDFGIISGT